MDFSKGKVLGESRSVLLLSMFFFTLVVAGCSDDPVSADEENGEDIEEEAPQLSTSTNTLELSWQNQSGEVTIENTGTDGLAWEVSSDQSWLSFIPSSGTGGETIEITVDANWEPIDRSAEVVISSNGGDGTVSVIQNRASGTVEGWGHDVVNPMDGQEILPPGLDNVVWVSTGIAHGVALHDNGTVSAWGDSANAGQTEVPAGLDDVVAIDAGYAHTVALREDGSVVAWGWNEYGQTNVPSGLDDAIDVSAGFGHTVAVKEDGSVVAWGGNYTNQLEIPAGLSGVVDVEAGGLHTLALKADGTIVAWGADEESCQNAFGEPCYGQVSDMPAGLDNVEEIVVGYDHNFAIQADGNIVTWGRDAEGQLSGMPAGLDNIVQIEAGEQHTIALTEDGTVYSWGGDNYGQTQVPAGLVDVARANAGFWSSYVIVAP